MILPIHISQKPFSLAFIGFLTLAKANHKSTWKGKLCPNELDHFYSTSLLPTKL